MKRLAETLRLAWRSIALSAYTAVLYALWVITRPTALVSTRLARRTHGYIFRTWARGATAIIGMRVRVEGTAPTPPFFLVANHLSYLDIVLLASLLEALFVSKAEVSRWPVVGLLARSMNTLFVDRTRKTDLRRVIGLIQEALERRQGVVAFPEGTSSKGAEVLPFKASLFEAPLAAGAPIATASLSYRTSEGSIPAWLSVCWWGEMTFFSHLVKLLRLPAIEAFVAFGPELAHGPDRKGLATEARAAIQRNFRPVVVPEAEYLSTNS